MMRPLPPLPLARCASACQPSCPVSAHPPIPDPTNTPCGVSTQTVYPYLHHHQRLPPPIPVLARRTEAFCDGIGAREEVLLLHDEHLGKGCFEVGLEGWAWREGWWPIVCEQPPRAPREGEPEARVGGECIVDCGEERATSERSCRGVGG